MGSLSTFRPVYEDVPVTGGQTITVRGLSLMDIGPITAAHGASIRELYNEAVADENAGVSIPHLIERAMREAPGLVADIIATACDEPELADEVRKIPGLDQFKLLASIAKQTFHSEDELGNAVDTLLRGFGALTNAMNRVSTESPMTEDDLPPLPAGFGDTEKD